jgi:hypothetical protein
MEYVIVSTVRNNFKAASGSDLPTVSDRLDPTYQKWAAWQTDRLKELWFLWDGEIRKQKSTARFIPNVSLIGYSPVNIPILFC